MNKLILTFILALLISPSIHSEDKLLVSWEKNKETDLLGYNVYWGTKSGKYSNIDFTVKNYFLIQEPKVDSTYFVSITAIDSSQNESLHSVEVFWTVTNKDTIPPKVPSGVSCTKINWR